MQLFKQLLLASRPASWVNTAYPFAVGYLLTAPVINPWIMAIGTLYFLVPYNLLMYGINDVFDYESDLCNPRKGGAQGPILGRSFHKAVTISAVASNLPFIVALLLLGNAASACVLAALLFFVVAYSAPVLRFKERPIVDSITSSIHFVGPLIYALALTGFSIAYWPYVIAFFLWGMASHAFGAVQDVVPDRAAGIASVATILGAWRTVQVAAILYTASSVILLARGGHASIVGAVGLLYVANIAPFLRISDPTSGTANAGWKRFMLLNMFTGFVITIVLLVS